MKGQVVIYSIKGCPFCARAKSAIADLGLDYVNVDVEKNEKAREYLKEKTGKRTVPQVFFNDVHVGGYDDLEKLIEDSLRINKLIEMVTENESPHPVSPSLTNTNVVLASDVDEDFVCEPDEFATFIRELKDSGLVKDHRHGLKVYKKSFQGREFVKWVMQQKSLSKEAALELGQCLIDSHYGHDVKMSQTFRDGDFYYRLLDDEYSDSLNSGDFSTCKARPASEVGEEIRGLILQIYNDFLSKDGSSVDYDGIAASKQFSRYVEHTKELQRVQIENSSREVKLAFFINIYNALVIHGFVVRGPPVNLWQRYKFFNAIKYTIGGLDYSLQDIENGILRGNKRGIGMIQKPFSKSDPRLRVALPLVEPLIHFALVCGAKSCPPIKTYSASDIVNQLRISAESFLDGTGCVIDTKNKVIHLSMIFKWYRGDFGKNDLQVMRFVHSLLGPGSMKDELQLLMKDKYAIKYMRYDWSLNKN